MVARYVPSNVAEMVDWLAGSVSAQTGMILNIGAGGASGDLVFKTNTSEAARFLFGSAGPPDTRGTLLFNHGDNQEVNTGFGVTTGRYLDIRHGSVASPDTTYAPTVKVSRTFAHAATKAGTNALNSATVNVTSTTGFASSGTAYLNQVAFTYTGKTATSFTGCGNHAATTAADYIADFPLYSDGAEQLATIVGVGAAINNSGVQPIGGYFGATNDSTLTSLGSVSPDAVGVYGHARIIPTGTGVAAGVCSVASKADSAATLTSQQVFVLNSGTDTSYSPTAISDCAFWIVSSGSKRAGAGLLFPHSSGNFDVGIGFMSGPGSGGGIVSAAVRDDSSAVTSLLINGTHTTGIDVSGGTYSGKAIQLGNAQALAAKTSGGTAGNLLNVTAAGLVQLSSATFSSVVLPNNIAFGGYSNSGSTAYNLAHVTNVDGVYLGDNAVPTTLAGAGVTCVNALDMNAQNITGMAKGEAAGEGICFDQLFGTPSGSMAALLFPGLVDLQVFGPTASAAWIKPASGKVVVIIAQGAGGGGGGGVGGANSLFGGAGGGAGDFMVAYLPYGAMPSSATVQVGAGGAGGAGSSTTTGNAGSNGSRSTIFDTGNNTLTAPAGGGGGAGGTSQGAAGAGASAGSSTTYTGYTIAAADTTAGAGGQSSITTNAAAGSSTGGGGAGGGITSGGAVAGSGGANTAGAVAFAATAASATAGAMGAVLGNVPGSYTGLSNIRFGGGGGDSKTSGTAGAGGVGFSGGGGGGGGSNKAGGTGGAGGAGGDGRLVVMVFN